MIVSFAIDMDVLMLSLYHILCPFSSEKENLSPKIQKRETENEEKKRGCLKGKFETAPV